MMMLAILIVASGLSGSASAAPAPRAREPLRVSMVALIANPAQFEGRFVETEGYVVLEFEGTAVYLSENDYKAGLTFNAIYLGLSGVGSRFEASAQSSSFGHNVETADRASRTQHVK